MAYFSLEQRRWRRYCLESSTDTGPKIMAGNTFSDGIGYKRAASCDDACVRGTPHTAKARPSFMMRIWNCSHAPELDFGAKMHCIHVWGTQGQEYRNIFLPHLANSSLSFRAQHSNYFFQKLFVIPCCTLNTTAQHGDHRHHICLCCPQPLSPLQPGQLR